MNQYVPMSDLDGVVWDSDPPHNVCVCLMCVCVCVLHELLFFQLSCELHVCM